MSLDAKGRASMLAATVLAVMLTVVLGYGSAGIPYLELREWARSEGLNVTWEKKGKVWHITGNRGTMVLKNNSACALFNGVRVWLFYVVQASPSSIKVSEADLEHVIKPLFQAGAPRRVRVVVIDPGHGGRDRGYSCRNISEKSVTLTLANQLRSQLKSKGYTVVLTRNSDTGVSLSDRAAKANAVKGDLFVSLHCNATEVSPGSAKGVEVYCLTPVNGRSTNSGRPGSSSAVMDLQQIKESVRLAFLVQSNVVNQVGMQDRGVRFGNFEVLRLVRMPGILIETGFLSNPSERERLLDPSYQARLVMAICDAIHEYARGNTTYNQRGQGSGK